MAIINKIREKSGLAVGVVAVGLILFLVGGDLLGPNSMLLGNRTPYVGEIAGEKITLAEYQEQVERIKYDYAMNTGRTPSEAEMGSIREQAWNQLIFDRAFQKEYAKLGLAVTADEKVDMVQGNNIHPAVRSSFTNPETGEFDVEQVRNFLRNLPQMPPQQQDMWLNFEAKLPEDRLRTKYENLFTKTTYVTKAEAEREYRAQNVKADFSYVYIPYTSVPDSAVNVTDSQLKDYLNRNSARYRVEDTRTFDYVVFSVQPSSEDSLYYREELDNMVSQFRAAENDSAFARSNSDQFIAPSVVSPGELPEDLTANLNNLAKGQVYGPFAEGNTLTLYKISDIRTDGPMSARASHILFKPANETPEAKAEALAQARKVLNEIKGGASFEEMARVHGTDGTAPRGGDLGWFSEGRMVKPFEDAIFKSNRTGLLPEPVETNFGYHLIKITEPKTSVKYEVATIQRNLAAGDAARDEVFRTADQFASTAGNKAEFEQNLNKFPGGVRFTADRVAKNANSVNNLADARELIRWSFNDASIGSVSRVFEIGDDYVVAVLTDKTEKGTAQLSDVRDQVYAQVVNKAKAEVIINRLKSTQGASVQEIGTNYGPEAVVNNSPEVTLTSNALTGIGFDPAVVGRGFGLKPGQRSAPFAAENGVVIIEATNITDAPAIADYAQYRNQVNQRIAGRVPFSIVEAVKEKSDIRDNRVKYY